MKFTLNYVFSIIFIITVILASFRWGYWMGRSDGFDVGFREGERARLLQIVWSGRLDELSRVDKIENRQSIHENILMDIIRTDATKTE